MIVKDCVYNEMTDIHDVDQFGFVDLVECLENGQVPSTISDSEPQYNDIDDPGSILGKPSDVFEAYKMQDYVKSVGSQSTAPVEQE